MPISNQFQPNIPIMCDGDDYISMVDEKYLEFKDLFYQSNKNDDCLVLCGQLYDECDQFESEPCMERLNLLLNWS